MANIVRKEMGLDAAQAAGGWRSRSVVEKVQIWPNYLFVILGQKRTTHCRPEQTGTDR